ncbi:MAG: hypothetical protein ACI4W6_10325, partial [Acutalibacteraceae bacterium]
VCDTELSREAKTTDALGHTEVSADNAVAPTCTTAGKEADTICSVCGETIAEGAEIPATGHTEVSANNAVAPTCTKDGKKADTICSVCGALIKAGAKVPATGHNWVETSRTEATCSKDGSITYVCKNDSSHTKTETIPATGAHHDDDNDGLCDDCGQTYTPAGGYDNCICHRNNIFSKILRYICTLLTKIAHRRIACCDDMVYYNGRISSLS